MEWIWDAANSLGVAVLAVWAWFGFKYLGDENEQRKANIRKTQADVVRAKEAATEARQNAAYARKSVNELTADKQVIVGGKLPDTPHNESIVEQLRQAAARVSAKRAHPAGTGQPRRVPGVRRSAVTGRYVTHKNPTTQAALNNPGYDFLPVAAVIAATDFGSSSNSSYSDSSSSSSSSSSSDSGSFGGGDSGSF